MTPASSTIVVSCQDTAIMFIPNSPSPPRGTTSRVAGAGSGFAFDIGPLVTAQCLPAGTPPVLQVPTRTPSEPAYTYRRASSRTSTPLPRSGTREGPDRGGAGAGAPLDQATGIARKPGRVNKIQ